VFIVRSSLLLNDFTLAMEDDSSVVSPDVLSEIITEGERIGTLMVLAGSETWVKGICYAHVNTHTVNGHFSGKPG